MQLLENNQKQFAIENIIWHNDPVTREKIYQVIYFSEGSGEVQLDFATYEITSPQLFFISEFQLFTTLHGEDIKGKVLQFSNDFFCIKLNRTETFCDAVLFNTAYDTPQVHLDLVSKKRIEFLIDSMENELREESNFQDEIINAQLKTMLLQASKLKLQQIGREHQPTLSKLVTDFQSELEDNYDKEHSVQYYADTLFITPKGLNKATKKELGRTASELIKEKLIIEAKRELYQNQKSIKEIAYNIGFDDPAYFSRFFKKETQHSPKDYQDLAH